MVSVFKKKETKREATKEKKGKNRKKEKKVEIKVFVTSVDYYFHLLGC